MLTIRTFKKQIQMLTIRTFKKQKQQKQIDHDNLPLHFIQLKLLRANHAKKTIHNSSNQVFIDDRIINRKITIIDGVLNRKINSVRIDESKNTIKYF